jgi:transcriptional regulator of met regulon
MERVHMPVETPTGVEYRPLTETFGRGPDVPLVLAFERARRQIKESEDATESLAQLRAGLTETGEPLDVAYDRFAESMMGTARNVTSAQFQREFGIEIANLREALLSAE